MSLTVALYLIDVLNSIGVFLTLLTFVYCALIFVSFLSLINEDSYTIFKNHFTHLIIIILIFFISCFVPSKQTMYLMAGTSYLNSTNIPEKAQEALSLKLDDVIKKLKEDNK